MVNVDNEEQQLNAGLSPSLTCKSLKNRLTANQNQNSKQ